MRLVYLLTAILLLDSFHSRLDHDSPYKLTERLTIEPSKLQKIMIFGRPGSGKSTFAYQLSNKLALPLYHLDKYFFKANWVERDADEFMQIQQQLVSSPSWIIDGNCLDSLATRWSQADGVLYFNYPRYLCLYRLIKRRLLPQSQLINDRAEHCPERLRFALINYMWGFEQRVAARIKALTSQYSHVCFKEIKSDQGLQQVKSIMTNKNQN